jgi:hypothetical protein
MGWDDFGTVIFALQHSVRWIRICGTGQGSVSDAVIQ